MSADDEEDPLADLDQRRALYDFDPSTIDWPYVRQKPLALTRGQIIQVIHDEGKPWALGHYVGQPKSRGYYPRNYVVSLAEYDKLREDYENEEDVRSAGESHEEGVHPDSDFAQQTSLGPLLPSEPPLLADQTQAFRQAPGGRSSPELVIPGLAQYPVLQSQPPQGTAYELNKSRVLRHMPTVPDKAPEKPAPPEDDIMEARAEIERDLAERLDPMAMAGGQTTDSRASTPANLALTRPEFDFVRKDKPHQAHTNVTPLASLVRTQVVVQHKEKLPYPADLRVRSTTVRLAYGIEPRDMAGALRHCQVTGRAKWTQMFRPGFNDKVNESFKVGCNACILSSPYLKSKDMREQFQKLHGLDVGGTLWFDLERRKDHYFYLRMDLIDVMLCHPQAWRFPDTNRLVKSSGGEPLNPFHGWMAQASINTDREMEDVDFLYTLRKRGFPEQTFQALSLGKIPDWIQPYASLHSQAQPVDDSKVEDDGGIHGQAIQVDNNLLMEAGLEDNEDLYVKLDETGLARERTVGPDVLDAKTSSFKLKGLSAMRIFLRSRGNPDNMKQTLITPKMVKDMASQLGIKESPQHYWYCMFALRYCLAPDWEAVVRNDTRWYLHLPSDRSQPVHPMIRRFREHLDDCIQNEFLWDYRGFVKMKCSECGIPDSVLWCQQCTDNFCASCFLRSHQSRRGKKHWPMPIPGSRYLTASEAQSMKDHCPLLNIGASNRRRFLARDNQSDKNGSRNGDSWLFFHSDTFQAALVQAPEEHWCLKRLHPPRLAPDVEGYYYNFASDFIADDPSLILNEAKRQWAIDMLQKTIHGAHTRRQIEKETQAALVIQKTQVMWEVQKVHGSNGKNAALLKSWYRKYKAKEGRLTLNQRLAKMQAVWQGYRTRNEFHEMMRNTTRFQASFRGLLERRRHLVLFKAVLRIQRCYRGHLYGRRVMHRRHDIASRIQFLYRGGAQRDWERKQEIAVIRIQSHASGMLARSHVQKMLDAGLKIQRVWRKFQARLDVKITLYQRLEEVRRKRREVMHEKLKDAAATLIQRNWRRHCEQQTVDLLKKEKGEADKRISTVLVALFTASGSLRHYLHPWFRHLPKEIQDVLQQIKGSFQRTIGMLPVTGKLANEEIGRRGLRVASAADLTYDRIGKDPDLASHMLMSITRHLLSHVPVDLFEPTLRWACYAISHQAVLMHGTKGIFPKEEIPVGKEMPPHQRDTLSTMWTDFKKAKHHHDELLSVPDESLPCLVLKGLPTHQRHVYLTAEVLITMRQALDSANLSTDDHLKFQGLDDSAGAQLMEVLGCEIDHRLPLDWPRTHGTVSSLAAQMGTDISFMRPQGGMAAVAKTIDVIDPDTKKLKTSQLLYFNRGATLRVLQQVGYFMRDQHSLLLAVLGLVEEEEPALNTKSRKGQGVRQSRYIVLTDKLFDMADRAKHDHCSFVLAVVLFHMVLRSLFLRVLNHRAAIAIQKRYRYLSSKGKSRNSVAPAIIIQRFWRGLHVGLRVVRKDEAARRLQSSFRAWRSGRRDRTFLMASLMVQRIWRGAIQRKWLRECHKAATDIQRCARGLLVRAVLDKNGRELVRRHRAEQAAFMRQKNTMAESTHVAKLALMAAKARLELHRHRERRVEILAIGSFAVKSRHARALDKQRRLRARGSLQPVRLTVFEPMNFAIARMEPRQPWRGTLESRVLLQVRDLNRALDRTLTDEDNTERVHAALRRGRAALAARRLAKRPRGAQQLHGTSKMQQSLPRTVDDTLFSKWLSTQTV